MQRGAKLIMPNYQGTKASLSTEKARTEMGEGRRESQQNEMDWQVRKPADIYRRISLPWKATARPTWRMGWENSARIHQPVVHCKNTIEIDRE